MKIVLAIVAVVLALQCVHGATVAFSVRRFSSFYSPAGGSIWGTDKRVQFNSILRNDYNGYSITGRYFRAPIAGVYNLQFSASRWTGFVRLRLRSQYGSSYQYLATAESNTAYSQLSNSVVVNLRRSERVYVYLQPGTRIRSNSPASTTFSGFMLYPTF